MVSGELLLRIGLRVLMLRLYVDNLDIAHTVSFSTELLIYHVN